jgi:hypothetical protein
MSSKGFFLTGGVKTAVPEPFSSSMSSKGFAIGL